MTTTNTPITDFAASPAPADVVRQPVPGIGRG
jgi:hypothetical protein